MMNSINHFRSIPFFGKLYENNYYYLKQRYWNVMRKTGIIPGPYTTHWISTFRCNANCVYCEASANEVKGTELTTKEIKTVLDDLRQIGGKQFFIAGGEPLVRKDTFEVIDYASHCGLKVFMITNSILYNKFKEEFKKADISTIWTSVDGLAATHNRNRGYPNSYEIALAAIGFYKEIGIPVRVVNTFVSPDNFEELPELFKALKNAGITRWRLALAIPVGRGADSKWTLSDRQRQEFYVYAEQLRKGFNIEISCELGYLGSWDSKLRDKPFYCFAGLTQCAIMPFGEVLPCQTIYNMDYSEGNVKETSIKDIWKNGFKRFRDGTLEDKCKSCNHVKTCRGGCWSSVVLQHKCLTGSWKTPS